MPELASIKKRRRVYVKDNIRLVLKFKVNYFRNFRINLDDVENLGLFVDIEVSN
jgi:adenylate cyclase class IV